MDLYIVLLLFVTSLVHLSHGNEAVVEETIVATNIKPLGSWHEANPNGQDVIDAAKKAVENFNMKSKAKVYFRLLDVTSAEVQVTNRINYKIKAVVGKTKCLKTETVDLELCDLAMKKLNCKFDVQYNPRIDDYVAKTQSCNK